MKNTWAKLTISMILVLVVSFLGTHFLVPLLNRKSYSQTACLTDQITESMDIYDIAKLYRDNLATVAVTVQGNNNVDGYTYTSLGSGVCVASNGYETTDLETNIVASTGSYVATNYHVIDMMLSNDFSGTSLKIITEEEVEYSAQLLWHSKDLDLALIYTDKNLDYVKMQDRVIFCTEEDKLDYEPAFTIGTPLELSYLNRLTIGSIASNNTMIMPSAEYIYPYTSGGELKYSNYYSYAHSDEVIVMSNTYEDVVDISIGITSGNSGGGCFDSNGVLVGLTTLGLDASVTAGNQMNGIVPIYPIIEVLDRVIANKEQNANYSIHTLESLDIVGIDAYEAYYCSLFQEEEGVAYYFIDGNFFSTSQYANAFNFSSTGYYILKNNGSVSNLTAGKTITGCTINGETNFEIVDRNDLIYALLQIRDGDNVTFTSTNILGYSSYTQVQF